MIVNYMRKNIYVVMLFLGIIMMEGCTDLQEEVLDESLTGNVTNGDIVAGSLAPAYATLSEIFLHTRYFAVQEISTDEAILPYRGGTDWGDNGIYMAMHQHTYTSQDPNIRNTWNLIFQGQSRALTAMYELPKMNDPNAALYLAEARGMRAFYSM